MTPAERFAEVRRALLAVREAPPAEREARLAEVTRADPEVGAEVASLLARVDAPVALLDDGPSLARLGLAADDDVRRVGPYLLRERLGEGGMGVVYRAEQEAPLRREVAVKLVRGALRGGHVVARFEQERQVLARLAHPNIARVLDAGADGDERPYFVMELVRGAPITRWCEARAATLEVRLALFLATCDGVAHAHRRGVIHRDLKPSNVLVCDGDDGAPTPKIIDFGIAKALGDAGDGEASETLTFDGQVLGTPEYMSPEQAGAFGGAVDTRTDVYALGVILYELLTDTRPLRVSSHDLPVLRQRLLEAPLERPSARGPSARRRAVAGDLDTIVMRALEKDPERRYPSVDALADDVRRHMAGLPIHARAPTLRYRLGKLVRRHRVAVATGVGALVALLVFVATLVAQAGALAEESARARREAASADAVATFMIDLFEGADPTRTQGAALTARALVDRGAEVLSARRADDDPQVRARLLHVLARVYHNLGAFDRADRLLSEALALRVATLGLAHPEALASLAFESVVAHDLGDDARAIARARDAIALRTLALGSDDLGVAESTKDLAVALESAGREREAEPLYRRAVEAYRLRLGDDAPEVAWAVNKLGQAVLARSSPTEARALFEHALAVQRAALGELHPDVGSTLNNLAGALRDEGDLTGALATWRETLALFERLHGDAHPDVGRSHANIASVLRALGRPVEALDHVTIDLTLTRRLLGPEHVHVGRALGGLGQVLHDLGDLAGAEDHLREALALRRARLGEHHRVVGQNHLALARLYVDMGRDQDARFHAVRARDILDAALGEAHALTREAASIARPRAP